MEDLEQNFDDLCTLALTDKKKLEGVAEIRDESSMEGLRIVFEVKRDAEPLVVLNKCTV